VEDGRRGCADPRLGQSTITRVRGRAQAELLICSAHQAEALPRGSRAWLSRKEESQPYNVVRRLDPLFRQAAGDTARRYVGAHEPGNQLVYRDVVTSQFVGQSL
jgi:hypothetical protein